MPLLGGIAGFLDKYLIGYALGTAAGPSLEPFVQDLANAAWEANQAKPLDPADAAAIVAEDVEQMGYGKAQAAQTGIDGGKFEALVGVTLNAPGLAELFELWRRGQIGDADFEHGLRKARLETRWTAALRALRERLLAPADLANARQQEFIDDARLEDEGGLQGYDAERMQLLYKMAGLPPGPMDGLAMLRRGILTEAEYAQLVAEGHTKTKYTDKLLALRQQVLSARDYAELRLRGWITAQQSYEGGALTGYTPEQMDRLFENRGRPATPRQMWLAIRRSNATRADFDRAIKQSNIRTEYTDWLWDTRYSYPSLFQLRGAVQQGGLTPARALVILSYQGYEDQDAQAIVTSWTKAGAAKGRDLTAAQLGAEYEGLFISEGDYRAALTLLGYSPAEQTMLVHLGDAARVKKYRDAVVTRLYKLFTAFTIDAATVSTDLAQIGVSAEASGNLLSLWTLERDVNRKQLTAAQIKRAYIKGLITQAEAVAELGERGYSAADAAIYLAE